MNRPVITPDKRLQMLAGLVVPGRKIVDVGTDHGFLPAFLLLSGISPSAVGADVGEKPLENARRTLERYGLAGRLRLVLSDGLLGVSPHDAEEIVLAGMGGTLMVRILEAAPWLCEPGRHLILQPMSRAEEVRRFLCENGFYIERETACEDGRRLYGAISAYWDGRAPLRASNGSGNMGSSGYYHFGELPQADCPAARKLIERHVRVLRECAAAMEGVERRRKELLEIVEALRYYDEIVCK